MSEQSEAPPEVIVEPEPGDQEAARIVARYGLMGHLGVFGHDFETPPAPGTLVVARTGRGAELARVLISVGQQTHLWCISPDSLEEYLTASGPEYPVSRGGRALRLATAQDINDQQHLDRSAREEQAFCREQIRQIGLEMRLICVEHLLGGERIVFYFTAAQRVDFRELVRRLANQYHTRIEMRQVGARDEARLVADYERCGRRCCCQEFLKLLKPVSMKMAKSQKATLDPTKISGRCGRLMCCLRYEDATYEKLLASLPKRNTWVRTADGAVGKVVEVQILTQLVRLMLPDQAQMVVANEDVVERNLAEPPSPAPAETKRPKPAKKTARRPAAVADQPAALEEPPEQAERPAPPKPEPAREQASSPAPAASPQPAPAGEPRTSRRRKGRRRRKKKTGHPEALSAPPQSQPQASGASGRSDAPAKKKSRGKRRKGRGGRRGLRKPGG